MACCSWISSEMISLAEVLGGRPCAEMVWCRRTAPVVGDSSETGWLDIVRREKQSGDLRHQSRYHVLQLAMITPRSGWRLLSAIPRRSALFPRQYSLRSGVVRRSKSFAKYAGLFCLSSAVGIVTIGTGILVHDAFTYSERHIDRVPVNPLALHPERGGPKNLPIAHVLVDDEEDDEAKALSEKPKLVIVGAGWGVSFRFSTSFLPS